MNSIAIWWDNSKSVKVHLDVNIWHIKESKDNYLEFGLKIEDYKELSDVSIYIPYSITKSDIEDKVSALISDSALTNAMFNESLDVSNGSGSFHKVRFPNEPEKSFLYYELNINKDVNLSGNIIKLTINKDKENTGINTIYYRFRIKKVGKIFTELKENYFWVDGFFKTIGFIEVNINSVRKLPKEIVNELGNVKFNSMNLFLMTDSFTNFIFNSKDVKKSRILENHIWDKYLTKENSKKINKIIAYHWNKIDKDIENKNIIPFEDYNLFVKISYIRKDIRSWLTMLILILTFGIVSGVSGNYVTMKLLDNFETTKVEKTEDKNIQGENNATN